MVSPAPRKIVRIGATGSSGKLIDVDTLTAAIQYTYHIDIRGYNQVLVYVHHEQLPSVGTCAFVELRPLFHFARDDAWDNQGWATYPDSQPFENSITKFDTTTSIHDVQHGPYRLPLTVVNNAVDKMRIAIPSEGDNYVQFTYRGLTAGGLATVGGTFYLDIFGAIVD